MLSSLLPKPKYSEYQPPTWGIHKSASKSAPLHSNVLIPSLQKSSVTIENTNAPKNTLQKLHLHSDGTLDYSTTLASASNPNRRVQASYKDTVSLKQQFPNLKHSFPRYDLTTCPDDSLKECVITTKKTVDAILKLKLGVGESSNTAETITSSNDSEIQVATYREDPLLPPRFKLRKNRHSEAEAPAPVLKKTQEAALTKEDREKWKIPAAVSNWKNNMGFTISIDKRMQAAHGGTSNDTEINVEKFSEVSLALQNAEKEAREELSERREMMRQLEADKQREREQRLRELAEEARRERRPNKRRNDDNDNYNKRRHR